MKYVMMVDQKKSIINQLVENMYAKRNIKEQIDCSGHKSCPGDGRQKSRPARSLKEILNDNVFLK